MQIILLKRVFIYYFIYLYYSLLSKSAYMKGIVLY